jgi:hypothetical protein
MMGLTRRLPHKETEAMMRTQGRRCTHTKFKLPLCHLIFQLAYYVSRFQLAQYRDGPPGPPLRSGGLIQLYIKCLGCHLPNHRRADPYPGHRTISHHHSSLSLYDCLRSPLAFPSVFSFPVPRNPRGTLAQCGGAPLLVWTAGSHRNHDSKHGILATA